MRLTFHGGAGEIGGTKILLEDGDTSVFLDFGLSFKRRGTFYQQFLTPRTHSGVPDLLRLGIIPDVPGLYRDDPVGGVESPGQPSVAGVLLSHPHVDHAGHISLLRSCIPVYGSQAAHCLIDALERTGQPGFESEILTSSFRVAGQYRYEKRRRSYVKLSAGTPAECGSLTVTMHPVDHSVPGSCGFIIRTSAGNVAYTGDFRLHGRRAADTVRFLQVLRDEDIAVLLIEGTNAAEHTGPGESEVWAGCTEIMDGARGKLVFCTFAARDLDRLATFHELARASGRRLVVGHKTAHLLEAVGPCELGLPGLDDVLLYTPRRRWGTYDEREYDVWERPYLGRGNAVRASAINKSPGDYLMYLDFFSLGELIDIDPAPGAVMIHSQAEPFNEEMELDFERLQAWLSRFEVTYAHAHASGHIHGGALAQVVAEIGAETVIPVHTEHPELFTGMAPGVVVVRDGDTLVR